jgi:hypothetical protein
LGWRQLFEEKQLHIAIVTIVSNKLKLYLESIYERILDLGSLKMTLIRNKNKYV